MGIGGHVLGPRKLRKLSGLSGLPLNRAYIRNEYAEGVVWNDDGTCTHYEIDKRTGEHSIIDNPGHWTSCTSRPTDGLGR